MGEIKPLTDWEVKTLVFEWFRRITIKVPVETVLPMLSSEHLEMRFPDSTITSYDDFKQWYATVTHQFFNQVHEIKTLDIRIDGAKAIVNLVVNWQAETWTPPEARSKREGFYIYQNWIVRRDSKSEQAVIERYEVGEFEDMH